MRILIIAVLFGLITSCAIAEQKSICTSPLSVHDVMKALVETGTNKIWRAQEVNSDEQWAELRYAAVSIIAGGDLISHGGAGKNDCDWAATTEWQKENSDMITAANDALSAIEKKDLDALSEIGSMALYSPCENCHRLFLKR